MSCLKFLNFWCQLWQIFLQFKWLLIIAVYPSLWLISNSLTQCGCTFHERKQIWLHKESIAYAITSQFPLTKIVSLQNIQSAVKYGELDSADTLKHTQYHCQEESGICRRGHQLASAVNGKGNVKTNISCEWK